jgi:hypothetical protein
MYTAREYREFAVQCIKWATEAETGDAERAFITLADDWTYAALHADRLARPRPIFHLRPIGQGRQSAASPAVNHQPPAITLGSPPVR